MLPNTIWLILTYQCNDRCSYCYASSACFPGNRPHPTSADAMPITYAKEVMTELKSCGAENCLLIGGEPTLYPHLLELVEEGNRLGLKMKLVTNGRRLADRRYVESLKSAGLAHASVSIEASTKERHDAITRTHGFRQRLAGLSNLNEAGLSHNSILTLSVQNADEIVPVAELMHTMGVRNILYNFSLPSVSEADGVDGSFSLNPQACADAIVEAYRSLKAKGIQFTFFATIPLCLIDEATRREMVADKTIARGYHCHIFYGTGAAFEPNGNVLPCTHFVGSPLFNAMDECGRFAFHGRFASEWENGSHKAFIEASWKYPSSACEPCDLWGICLGGCPFQWMHFDPQVYIPGPRKEVRNGRGEAP